MERDINFYKHRIRTHPGKILIEDYLTPLRLSVNDLASAIYLSVDYVEAIVNEKEPVNANVALRFARYFGTSAEFWINLQSNYDLSLVASQKALEIEHIRPCPKLAYA